MAVGAKSCVEEAQGPRAVAVVKDREGRVITAYPSQVRIVEDNFFAEFSNRKSIVSDMGMRARVAAMEARCKVVAEAYLPDEATLRSDLADSMCALKGGKAMGESGIPIEFVRASGTVFFFLCCSCSWRGGRCSLRYLLAGGLAA